MRVMLVSSDTNIGGAGKCVITLLKNLDKAAFEPTLLLPRGSLLTREAKGLGVRVIEADIAGDKSLKLSDIGKIRKIIKETAPDLVHTHASMSARAAARLAGVKVIYTRHSVFPPPWIISRGLGKKINGAVNNFLSDGIIAVAEAAKQNLVNTGVDPRKIKVILNGIEAPRPLPEKARAEYKEALNIPAGRKVITIAARLEDVKGHSYLIGAAKRLIGEGADIAVVIAGTGSLEDELRRMARPLGERIIFTGFLEDIAPLMSITDIQANCSFGTEATSLALLEGMSMGKPAVATDFGGNPGVIKNGENGLIVPIKDEGALARAISKLLEDAALYERMAKKAGEIFEKTFTAGAMTRATEKYYTSILNGRP